MLVGRQTRLGPISSKQGLSFRRRIGPFKWLLGSRMLLRQVLHQS